jgi:F-type H+-transporting ATPase subunit delta
LTTAAPLDDQILDLIKQNVQKQFPDMTIDMSHKIDESLLGGFIVESNNNQFDASILRDLRDIKKQFLKNEYIPSI